jgi:hypothetical protein
MLRQIFFPIIALLLFENCNAQQAQTRTVQPFSNIRVSGIIRVLYTQSDSLEVKVSGRDADALETKVENSTLILSSKEKSASEITVYIRNNRLAGVETSGATGFKTTNQVKADSITFNASGASEVNAKVDADKIITLQSGASNLVLEGNSGKLVADLSGASNLKAYGLKAANASVVSTGAANAKIMASETVKANASGASNIKIKGDPRELTSDATTAAKVSRVKDLPKKDGDTTTYNWKNKKVIVIDLGNKDDDDKEKKDDHESSFKHWKGIAVGVNGYLNPAGTLTMNRKYSYMDLNYARSFNWQFNLIENQIRIVKNYVKIVTGLGIDFHMYELAQKTHLNADSSFTWGNIDSSNIYTYKKNKFRDTYLQIPLLLEFNTSNNPDKTFHIAVGVVGQYLLSSRTKQKLEQNKNEITNVRKDSYNLNPFGAKAHVNLGYRGWTVFGEYSLTQLFKTNQGPELYPFSVGIRVIPFS